ncbi:FAD dependent oxidoreductase [Saccharata proteae CBS 121410]|uniref:FAD dependent oxidoreductase n=1 Tax=Saccharata proteae CBS 121410 TaxID=1314787 RepID=A0A9P4HVB5_9PEZI|nr:FAD dependent oxidoreductase [Saccharata proteae CBS 121410]
MSSSEKSAVPSSILIVGSGVFGLSTAYSLATNPAYKNTTITVVDRQSFPAGDASSIDSSRIIRPDYADPAYAALAYSAMPHWRGIWGASGRYTETGLCLTAERNSASYVQEALANVRALEGDRVLPSGRPNLEVLDSAEEIRKAAGTGGASGSTGYVNWTSGWADAEACMRYLHSLVVGTKRVDFVVGTVSKLILDPTTDTCAGVYLSPSSTSTTTTSTTTTLTASLTILATGAWTPSLLDLRGIARSTGQVIAYAPLTPTERLSLSQSPTVLNLTDGCFVIPPGATNEIKVARHGHGYSNPVTIPHPETDNNTNTNNNNNNNNITVSLPLTHLTTPTSLPPGPSSLPAEATTDLRRALSAIVPGLATRPFCRTRLCWYTDTRTGDFLIAHHPRWKRLFVATGGSGHGFKFLPVIGGKIVEAVEGRTDEAFAERWAWPRERVDERLWEGDGSRGGPRGLVLMDELARREEAKL